MNPLRLFAVKENYRAGILRKESAKARFAAGNCNFAVFGVWLQPPNPRIGGTFSGLGFAVSLEFFGSFLLKNHEI